MQDRFLSFLSSKTPLWREVLHEYGCLSHERGQHCGTAVKALPASPAVLAAQLRIHGSANTWKSSAGFCSLLGDLDAAPGLGPAAF